MNEKANLTTETVRKPNIQGVRVIYVWKDQHHYPQVQTTKPPPHLMSKRYYDADDVDSIIELFSNYRHE